MVAVADIDFNGFSLKNIPDPINGKDAVNKAYVDGKAIQPPAPIKPIITVNGKEQVNQSIVKKSGDICSCTIFRDPIELKQCDIINFISRTANNKVTNAYVSILIELDL